MSNEWVLDEVGTWDWPDEATAQFASENECQLSQIPHRFPAKEWLWRCSAGHEWFARAIERAGATSLRERWRQVAGTWACPECAVLRYGPVYECGHHDPEMLHIDAIAKVSDPPTVIPGVCDDCRSPWACGGPVPIEGGDPSRECPSCEESRALLDEHPDRQELVDQWDILPHQAKGVDCAHKSLLLDLYDVAHGYSCRVCWKIRQSDGWKTAPGEVLRVERYLPTSKLEQQVRDGLSERFDLLPPETANAVSIEGDVFGRGEVTPDILMPNRVAVEVDSPGRSGEWHTGPREDADRMKDEALTNAGWKVVRLRLGGLGPLESATCNVVADRVTKAVLEELCTAIAEFIPAKDN